MPRILHDGAVRDYLEAGWDAQSHEQRVTLVALARQIFQEVGASPPTVMVDGPTYASTRVPGGFDTTIWRVTGPDASP